jgi:phage repressor protein C with HTH and peptisase S24 domain
LNSQSVAYFDCEFGAELAIKIELKMLDNLNKRIAWAIKIITADNDLDKGITDVALAKLLGTNKNTLAVYRNMKGLLKGEVIDNLVARYNFSPDWFFKGEGEPFPGARGKYPDVCGPEGFSGSIQPDFPPDDFVFIHRVQGKISAGGGMAPDNDVDMQLAFRRDWIKKKGSPGNMSLIKVSGDSMEPTLLSGDLVLVNHSRNTIASQGGIYAIAVDDEIMIKRVQPTFPDKLLVISDNKQYPSQEIATDKVRVNGKVIWYARDLER